MKMSKIAEAISRSVSIEENVRLISKIAMPRMKTSTKTSRRIPSSMTSPYSIAIPAAKTLTPFSKTRKPKTCEIALRRETMMKSPVEIVANASGIASRVA